MDIILKYRLKDLRIAKGLPCIKMATKCQVTERAYRNWESLDVNSESSIPSDKLMILAIFFEVPMQDVYNKEYLDAMSIEYLETISPIKM